MIIWLASGNAHKKAEIQAVFNAGVLSALDKSTHFDTKIPADAGLKFDPEETGGTFLENALLKAQALRRLLEECRPALYAPGDPVIADDSGLCVDALGGRPGIYSARYAGPSVKHCGGTPGEKLSSAERNALLLQELGNAPNRSARFVCAMVLLWEPERFFTAQETFEGEIIADAQCARGSGGFGYDPILFIPELGCTVAELSEEEKNRVSHRGKAGRLIALNLSHNLRTQTI